MRKLQEERRPQLELSGGKAGHILTLRWANLKTLVFVRSSRFSLDSAAVRQITFVYYPKCHAGSDWIESSGDFRQSENAGPFSFGSRDPGYLNHVLPQQIS